MPRRAPALTALICALTCFIITGCGKEILFSEYRSSEIAVDGQYTDWKNSASYYSEKEKVLINFSNDNDYLYICLVTRNLDIEGRLMESGLCVWFDPSDKKKRNFGVRFPIGMRVMGMSMEEDDKGPREWRGEGDKEYERILEKDREKGADFKKKLEALEGLQYKLLLLKGPQDGKGPGRPPAFHGDDEARPAPGDEPLGGPPKDKPDELFLEEADKLGIQARIGRQNGYFVYELKMPLAGSGARPHAIEAKPDQPLGVGIEIGGMDMRERGGPPGGGMRGGGMPGGGKSLQLWLTVVLAAKRS
jgi:hypothetical protein